MKPYIGTLLHPVFLISASLFTANLLLEKIWAIYIPWVHAYMDDLLCMPVVLGITLWIFRLFHPQRNHYRFSWHHVIVAVVYYAILFEGVLPSFSPLYTRDYLDIVFYAAGGVIFYYTINR